jgi:hypothetical protein
MAVVQQIFDESVGLELLQVWIHLHLVFHTLEVPGGSMDDPHKIEKSYPNLKIEPK